MDSVTVIIETPKGKGHKLDLDPVSGYFKLNKVMPAGMVFPFDFGFIPATTGEDGDPLDVMVISEVETFTGCAVDCRIIGVITAVQKERNGEEIRNDRFIAIPEVSVQYGSVNKISELPSDVISQVESFFKNYNQQAGKVFNVLKRSGPAAAAKLVEKARQADKQTILFQLIIPVYRESGEKFPANFYSTLHRQLIQKFGGLTVYSRTPVQGFWEGQDGGSASEEMMVYEVMANEADPTYWQQLKMALMKKFDQEELVITSSRISRV